MLIRVCDICYANGGKLVKSEGRSWNSFYRHSVKLTADVCSDHKNYLKSMSPGDIPKLLSTYDVLEKKQTKPKKKVDPQMEAPAQPIESA